MTPQWSKEVRFVCMVCARQSVGEGGSPGKKVQSIFDPFDGLQ
jgi:hypothetical protein